MFSQVNLKGTPNGGEQLLKRNIISTYVRAN